MTRKSLRENVFKILFGMGFNSPEDMAEQTELALAGISDATDDEKEFIRQRIADISERADEIDKKLEAALTDWNLDRIGKAELAILRLAVYEIFHAADVPYKVAVNEAVELSKVYCNPEAKRFVNGVLAKFDGQEGSSDGGCE